MRKKSRSKSRGKSLVVAVLDDKRGPPKPPRRVDGTPGKVKVTMPANSAPFRRPSER